MAWHIGEFVWHGEIDNRVRGKVTGQLWLAGRSQPLSLNLAGDAGRDLAGRCWKFVNLQPRMVQLDIFREELTGTVGECTASRKLRVPEVPPREVRLGMDPPVLRWHWRNGVLIEWFNPQLGRVIVSSTDYQVGMLSDATWTMTEAEEQARQRAIQEAQRRVRQSENSLWMAFVAKPPGGAPRLIDRIRDRLNAEGAGADFERIVEEEIAHSQRERSQPPPLPSAPIPQMTPETGDHPLATRAHLLAMRLLAEPSERGWLTPQLNPEHPMADQVASAMKAAIKLAGGLNRRSWPLTAAECGEALAWLRRAHEYLEDALCAAEECTRQKLAETVWQIGVRAELSELAQEAAALIEELELRQMRDCE